MEWQVLFNLVLEQLQVRVDKEQSQSALIGQLVEECGQLRVLVYHVSKGDGLELGGPLALPVVEVLECLDELLSDLEELFAFKRIQRVV